jgi:hypothetical protein
MEVIMTRVSLFATAAIMAGLGGCAYFGRTINMAGAGVVLDKPFEPYDEASLSRLIVASSPKGTVAPGKTLEETVGNFSAALYTGTPSENLQNQMRDARNQVQATLLATSSNRCNAFKQLLRAKSTNTNFFLGSLASAAGAAGAIVTGGASQALSGVTAATNGVKGEFNADLLSNVTSTVIVPGIDKQRADILQEITNRRCLGISSYNLMQSLNDAIRYHAACSTDTGVAAAGSALSQSQKTTSPSTADVANAIDTMTALNAKMKAAVASGPAQPDGKPKGHKATAAAGPPAASGTDSTAPKQAGGAGGNAADPSQPPSSDNTSPTTAQSKTTTLLGEQIDYLQCPSLNPDGTLPATAIPTASTVTAQGAQIQYGQR